MPSAAYTLASTFCGPSGRDFGSAPLLSVSPGLILADEPTGQLDSKTAQEFLTLVTEVVDGLGAALVIATHDPAVAARMDRQWSINHGKLFVDTNKGTAP